MIGTIIFKRIASFCWRRQSRATRRVTSNVLYRPTQSVINLRWWSVKLSGRNSRPALATDDVPWRNFAKPRFWSKFPREYHYFWTYPNQNFLQHSVGQVYEGSLDAPKPAW